MENFIAINYHETRDFSKKVSVTFEFARQNFKPLVKSILLIAGPPVLIASLFMGSFFGDLMTASFNAGAGGADQIQNLFLSPAFWGQMGLTMLFFILGTVASIATVNNYIILYEEQKSNKISVTTVWERVRSTFGMYLGTTILFYIMVVAMYLLMVGVVMGLAAASPFLIFFGAAGMGCAFIYLLVASSLIYIVRAYERIGFFEAIGRSFSLVRGKWWSTLGIALILYLIVVVVSYVFLIPAYAVNMVSALHNLEADGAAPVTQGQSTVTVILFTLYYSAQILLYCLPNIGIAFQYFNLVERKEARGLISQIESIGQPGAPAGNADEHY